VTADTPEPSSPIGVFDSGIGGLTVVQSLLRCLPRERIFYFGDTARVPYGVRSAATICSYAAEVASFLLQREVKLLIIACNTIAAVAASSVKRIAGVPVLDVIDAGARQALRATRNDCIGIIGTPATVNSRAYETILKSIRPDIRTFSRTCRLFVPLAEEGWFKHPITKLVAEEYLRPLLAEGIDTLILGCTHYPLLKPAIGEVAGPDIALIDSADAMAERAKRLLAEAGMGNTSAVPPEHRFYITDLPDRFQTIGENFLGQPLQNLEVVRLGR